MERKLLAAEAKKLKEKKVRVQGEWSGFLVGAEINDGRATEFVIGFNPEDKVKESPGGWSLGSCKSYLFDEKSLEKYKLGWWVSPEEIELESEQDDCTSSCSARQALPYRQVVALLSVARAFVEAHDRADYEQVEEQAAELLALAQSISGK